MSILILLEDYFCILYYLQVFLSLSFSTICLLHPVQWPVLVHSIPISLADVAGNWAKLVQTMCHGGRLHFHCLDARVKVMTNTN